MFMDIDWKTSRKRNINQKDRMEKNSNIFFHNVYNGYKEISKNNSDRYLIVDAKQNKDKIHEHIWNKIQSEYDL